MSEKVSIWDSPRGMILQGSHTPGSASDDAVDTSLSLIDRDLFYDPNDEELDDYIAQQIKDGFDIEEMFEALPEAFSGIYNQIKETVAAVPNTELKKVPGTAIEALARGGTDTADLLMRIGSGMATMGLKVLPGDAATQYHNLPETIKSFSRGWFRQQRTIEQHRAKQMMGDANYSYLPSALVDNTLAEGLTLFADPGMVAGFGASTAARAMAKAAIKGGKSGIVSRGLVNAAVKTGQMQDALFGAVGSVAKLPVTGSVKALQGATEFISEGFEAVKANLPKTTKGLPVEVDIPTEGKIGFLRKKINQASNLADDAMELSSQIKLQSKRQNLPSALDRIARDSSVRPGARDLASMFDAMAKNPLSRGLLIPAYKTGKSIGKGAATGGALGLLSFDEEFAASSIAGGAMFGPFGELSSEIIFSKEKNRQQITNFIDDFKVKLDPDDLINFEAFTEGSREDQKFFAGLSYMFKNGHFRNGEGNLDVRFLNDEQYQKFGELRGERFGDTSGVNYVSSGGRNTVLINTDKKKYKREALAHELGHAIMKMPEVQDSLQVQDKLLFGDRVVKSEGGKEVLAFNYEGLLNKDWVDSFFENYVNGLDDITQKEYRSLSAEKKFLVARDEIHADSMRYFFKEFDPESFIRAGKVNNLKFRTKGSYERNLYNGLGGSLARGIVNNVLLARNSLGLYAVRNMAKSMGLIKDGTPLKLNDGRVFSNISEILEKKRENIRATDDPITDVIGNKWNLAKLNSKDSRDILSSFLPTVDIIRDENGDPVIRNGRYRFLNKRQRQKHDAERAKIVKEAIDSARQSGESRMHLSRFQELSNESYSGDYFTQEAIDAMIATSKRVITPHLLDTIMRLNDRMKGRTTDSGFIAEFVYNQVTETGKITPDITTSYRQMVPMIFEMSKTGRNFRVTGIDMNDLMSRLDRFEKADFKSERGKVFDIWRQDYRKYGGKDSDVDLSHNPIRELFLQDLWLYLSGLSEGKSGIDALGGKGNTTADLQTVTQKRDGLMRFLGFEKKDQEAINPNMFQELVDRNRIIKSFRLDRMQNLSISDHEGKINFGSYLGVQLNRMPTQRSSFMGAKSDVIPALNVRNEPSFPYADQIVDGKKTIETRRQSNLDKLIGKTVKIIRTTGPKSKEPAMVIGEVTITGKKEYKNLKSFREDSDKHLVSEGSGFDFDKPKIGYTLENAKRYSEEYPAMKNKGIVYTKQHDGPRNIVSDADPDPATNVNNNADSDRSVLNIFDTPEKVLKELGTEKPLLREVADYLSRRSQAEGKLDELTPENAKALGDVLFEEAAEALRRDQDAIGWYDRTMDEALEYLYKLHPEMKTDAGLDGLFKAVLAITSNGQDVPANFKRAEFLYKKYQETGKIISDGNWGGKNKDSINKGLKAFEEMTQQLGLEKTKDFLTREISIRDLDKVLKEYGLKPTTGELKEHTVIGAMVFGPKIGSFYGNLNKIFNSVTMDRWFMRTINRIRGTLTDPSAGAVESTGNRLLKEMKGKVSVALQKEIERIISDVGSAGFSISNYPKAKKYLKDTYKAVEKRKFKDRTKLEMPAQRLHLYLNSLNESPANGSERAWIRGAVEHAQSRLKAEKQIDISNADMQAVLWYWEKDLYQNLNVGNKTGARADYAGAARQLLEQE